MVVVVDFFLYMVVRKQWDSGALITVPSDSKKVLGLNLLTAWIFFLCRVCMLSWVSSQRHVD